MLWVDRMYGMYRFGRLGTVQDAVSSRLPAYLAVMAGRLCRRPAGYSKRAEKRGDVKKYSPDSEYSVFLCSLICLKNRSERRGPIE